MTTALNIEPADSLRFCRYIAKRCRDEGPRLTLRKALDEVLEEVILQESVSVINSRLASCIVAYFELFPSFKPQFVYNFTNRDDLIDTLRASCNIPFYFNGNVPHVSVRGGGTYLLLIHPSELLALSHEMVNNRWCRWIFHRRLTSFRLPTNRKYQTRDNCMSLPCQHCWVDSRYQHL